MFGQGSGGIPRGCYSDTASTAKKKKKNVAVKATCATCITLYLIHDFYVWQNIVDHS